MSRTVTMLYSVFSYLVGVAALSYLILFIADLYVPVTINSGSVFAPGLSGAEAIFWNIGLIAAWGFQHSLMARPFFKKLWTRLVPPPVERSTYLLFVAGMTALLVLFWTPMPGVLWDISGGAVGAVLLGVYFLGWMITLFSTFLINHFQLFGLEQAYRAVSRTPEKKEIFKTPLLYKLVRHPMMTGILISLWAIPELTIGRLVFSLAMTAYVLIGVYFEEKTLVAELGEEYADYREKVPALAPFTK